MDEKEAQALITALVDGELGDHIRSLRTQDMLTELASDAYDDEREWADRTAEWLHDNWL